MTKRWCPVCEDVAEGKLCLADSIPSVDPLDVPEPTTWGESGGSDAVCLSVYFDDEIYTRGRLFAPADRDIVDGINYVAGVKT
jgi:hypothetical protein